MILLFQEPEPAIRRAFEQALGGYIRDYKYDWRKHRIPPLQIEQANPLQFMLLDAAQQALDESGYLERSFDRSRAAVVVGTLFGGEFSHQLQVGLRLPEILDVLSQSLRRRDWNEPEIRQFCDAAESQILKCYPAINDQCGSFTSSTQASRIAKTLNIMGGAMAIDSGDCSSLAAIQSAQQLLASGIADYVFCATAQRDLDATSFEAWSFRKFETTAARERPPAPGEGVVVLLLRRLKDAIADKSRIHGIIREVRATKYRGPLATCAKDRTPRQSVQTTGEEVFRSPESSPLTRQFGHLQGASGLFEILGMTMAPSVPSGKSIESVIRTTTERGEFQVKIEVPTPISSPSQKLASHDLGLPALIPSTIESRDRLPITEADSNAIQTSMKAPISQMLTTATLLIPDERTDTGRVTQMTTNATIVRVWGVDAAELRQRLVDLNLSAEIATVSFPERAPYRLAIVSSTEALGRKVQIALDFLDGKKSSTRIQEQGVFYTEPGSDATPRIAVMFPGQGSQHRGMLADAIQSSPAATKILERADKSLRRFGLPPCSPWITGEDSFAENDLRATQLAMLTADVAAFAIGQEWGLRPDYLIGHSFGEYAALVAAGSIEFESAIAMTLARADAVASCLHGGGAMLSIGASLKEVQPLMANRTDIFISHTNAPRQTVVAGSMQSVGDLAATVKSLGIPAVPVPVTSPFHTPLLAAAQPTLKAALGQHRWRPPQIPLLSSVSGRFVADRDVIVENLTRQLIQPIDWLSIIERLLEEDVRVLVELGPGRVLTKLAQQIIGDRCVFVVSIDDPAISLQERQLRIQAAMETVGIPSMEMSSSMAAPIVTLKRASASFRVAASTGQTLTREPLADVKAQVVVVEPEFAEVPASSEESNSKNAEHSLSDFLVDVIVEQTGYPRDVIELDWDLEADLGIDSIRKAQILGELSEYFDLTSARERNSFHELRTIRSILEMLQQSPGKGDWLQSSASHADRHPAEPIVQAQLIESRIAAAVETAPNFGMEPSLDNDQSTADHSPLDRFLIDFVVERTGYPRDLIELDADLESDLGIDSIAKVQMIGEIRDHFHLTIVEASTRSAISEMRTLRQVRETIEAATTTDSISEQCHAELGPSDNVPTNGNHHTITAKSNRITVSESTAISFDATTADSDPPSRVQPASRNVEQVASFSRGQNWGKKHKLEIQNQLFDFADRMGVDGSFQETSVAHFGENGSSVDDDAELHGIADGASVHPQSMRTLRQVLKRQKFESPSVHVVTETIEEATAAHLANDPPTSTALFSDTNDKPRLTQRFRLEMSPAEQRPWSGDEPDFAGGVIVIGDQPECAEVVRRFESFQVPVSWLRKLGTRDEAVAALEAIWEKTPSPHLFIMSPRDAAAKPTLDEAAWKARREAGITSLYWFCQKWLGLVEQDKLLEDASLIGVTALGGDFGISRQIESAESGAVTGLLKSIIIECWVNGYRTIPIKLLDLPIDAAATNAADAICVELTEPSYDVEIGWNGNRRSILRSLPAPLDGPIEKSITPTGNWVVTGGAPGSPLISSRPWLHGIPMSISISWVPLLPPR